MLFVAMSALQGRPMSKAFDELRGLGVAVQLTPGNHVTPGFREHVASSGVITRAHHGFAWDARRVETWVDGACVVASESVHPPKTDSPSATTWWAWFERATTRPILETMYPGYTLGDGEAIERLMDANVTLAVDVSHVFIQRTQGAMTDATWQRLMDYEHIAEVHVSANSGEHDSHRPLAADTFGLAWARERFSEGVPTVLECYMHKLDQGERQRQLDLVRENR